MGDMPPRLVLIENDDKGGVRSRPEAVDAIGEVVRAYRDRAGYSLNRALAALDARWPQMTAPGCPHPDTWQDPAVCPAPCGLLHTRCGVCHAPLQPCPWETK